MFAERTKLRDAQIRLGEDAVLNERVNAIERSDCANDT